jgi:hypothetical protein
MTAQGKASFADLGLDEDMYYPVPMDRGGAVHKLPAEMNRQDRRAVMRIVERCERHSLSHPYKGRMGD